MSTSAISSSASSGTSSSVTSDTLNNVTPNDFLKLLLTELQNQDPLDPMKSSDMVQQVSQIKAIQSNQQLTETLTSMQLQQELVAASTMLQKSITGLTDDGEKITGVVDRVSIDDTGVKLNIGEQSISLKNIAEVQPNG